MMNKVCEWCRTILKGLDDLVAYYEEGEGRQVYCKYCNTKRELDYYWEIKNK